MQTGWVLRDGQVLAAGERANSYGERLRGLIAKRSYDGAMLLPRTRSIHSFGVRFPMDVAFLDREMTVLATLRLRTWSMTLPRMKATQVLEAQAGSFERWGLRTGDRLEFRTPA